MTPWRPGEPLPLPIRRSVPNTPAGRPVLYLDQRTGQVVVARGASRTHLVPKSEPAGRPVSPPVSPWAGTASGTLHLSSVLGGIASASLSLSGARPGMRVAVSYTSAIPSAAAGAPFGCVTADDVVTVAVPLAATLGTVAVAITVAVARS